MKLGVAGKEVVGTVTHVYGYAETAEDREQGIFTKWTVMVKPDDGDNEVEIDQKHIIEIL